MQRYQKIKSDWESRGYTMISIPPKIEEFNVKTKITLRCKNGHEWSTTIRSIADGRDCRKCVFENNGKNQNLSSLKMIELIESNHFIMLEDNPVEFDRNTELNLKCSRGHIVKRCYRKIQAKGKHCPECKKEGLYRDGTLAKRTKTVQEKYGTNNVFQNEDIKQKIKQTTINKYGVENVMQLDEIKQKLFDNTVAKHGKFGGAFNKGRLKYNTETMKNIFKESGYEMLTEYTGIRNKVEFVCPKGHKHKMEPFNFLGGHRCKICANDLIIKRSKGEIELAEFIDSIYSGPIELNTKRVISPLEIDVYLPELKLGFEYNGIYYHSERFKDKNYHLDKLQKANTAGVRLIQIFEDEWNFKKDICKSRIENACGSSTKIGARKCEFKEIIRKDANHFVSENHIQGQGIGCNRAFGLYYCEELVSVMTFSKPSIAKGSAKHDWELNRFCNKMGISVVGAASKLLKNSGLTNIISYCDLRWSDGNLYKQLGFSELRRSIPNYWYVVDGQRKHRFAYRKNVLFEMLDDKNLKYENTTETELAQMFGLQKVYDAGNLVFSL